jgi:Fe-Mn family superoxide dismutase
MTFTLPELPYPADALEPLIDAETMTIHHSKHHGTYVEKLNAAIKNIGFEPTSIDGLCQNIAKVPEKSRDPIRNNGGGHWNHTLFWNTLTAPGKGGKPGGALASALEDDLGGYDRFKENFSEAATSRFGSGWAWLLVDADGKLRISSTPNQDNPLMAGLVELSGIPILGLDVWEHAYYLKYRNRRAEYVAAFFDLIDWPVVEENFRSCRDARRQR